MRTSGIFTFTCVVKKITSVVKKITYVGRNITSEVKKLTFVIKKPTSVQTAYLFYEHLIGSTLGSQALIS